MSSGNWRAWCYHHDSLHRLSYWNNGVEHLTVQDALQWAILKVCKLLTLTAVDTGPVLPILLPARR